MERVELLLIDELFAAFVASLPEGLQAPALGLAVTLGLAPSREVPWSQVFSHEITLGAPALVAEATPFVSEAVVRDAGLAHLLAILEALGTDRLEDGQAQASDELAALLVHVRGARDAAIARISGGDGGDPGPPAYAQAQAETLAAIAAEQQVLRAGAAITSDDGAAVHDPRPEPRPPAEAFARYLAISHGKQRVGLPASLALVRAAGWDARRTRALSRLLDAVWVGLQLHDDVLDWEDDLARAGAWAVSLAASASPAAIARPTERAAITRWVYGSGVLAAMLRASNRRFRAARRLAEALGARRLARWAREREGITADLARRETESPGYTNRAHALAAWAKTVLA